MMCNETLRANLKLQTRISTPTTMAQSEESFCLLWMEPTYQFSDNQFDDVWISRETSVICGNKRVEEVKRGLFLEQSWVLRWSGSDLISLLHCIQEITIEGNSKVNVYPL